MTQKTPAGLADCFTCCEVPQGCPERLVREAFEDAAESPEELEAFDAAENQTFGQQTGSVDEPSLGRDQQKRPSRGGLSHRGAEI
jgi:hypothetical protein